LIEDSVASCDLAGMFSRVDREIWNRDLIRYWCGAWDKYDCAIELSLLDWRTGMATLHAANYNATRFISSAQHAHHPIAAQDHPTESVLTASHASYA
jgi:hypothetical protein